MKNSFFSSAAGRFLAPAMLAATAFTGVMGFAGVASAEERFQFVKHEPVQYVAPVLVGAHHDGDADDRAHYGKRVDRDGWKYEQRGVDHRDHDGRSHGDGRGAGERGEHGRGR
jgi:hypothetical protein